MVPIATVLCSSVVALHAPYTFAPNRPRARTIQALVDLPPGFEEFVVSGFESDLEVLKATSQQNLQQIVGACGMIGACSTIVPPTDRRQGRSEEDTELDSSACEIDILPDGRSVPIESSFGWHQLDLRTPLPSLTELSQAEHPIGLRDGKRVYLCTARAATKYGVVERSSDFSDHYGSDVYICQRA